MVKTIAGMIVLIAITANAQMAAASTAQLLRAIAYCESRGRQFDENGMVMRGKKSPHDVGIFQLNERLHRARALRLGMDIYTPAGNRAYAAYLLRTYGTRPWNASKRCWSS